MFARLATVAVPTLYVSVLPAHAVPVTYNLTGTVTQVGTLPPVSVTPGQVIPISIQVDTAATASPPGSGHYSSTITFNPGSGRYSVILSALFDGQDLSSLAQTIDVTGTSIRFATTGPQIGYGFQLALSGAPRRHPVISHPAVRARPRPVHVRHVQRCGRLHCGNLRLQRNDQRPRRSRAYVPDPALHRAGRPSGTAATGTTPSRILTDRQEPVRHGRVPGLA